MGEVAKRAPIIEFVDVKKAFGSKVVLDGASCAFYEGEVSTIIGKSGVGKSVFLKHIVGLLTPDSGQILVNGVPLDQMAKDDYKRFKAGISYMFQSNALFDSMTVYGNIALPLEERGGLSREEIKGRVYSKAEQLELVDVLQKYPSQISGGMQKRVALARALVTDPKLVLFDEPTAGLDPLRKNAVFSMVHHYQKSFGFTGIMVSHDIPDVFYISDRVAILDGGKIIFQGPPMDLEQDPSPTVKLFIGGEMGLIDELTGLLTSTELEQRVQQAAQLRAQSGSTITLAMFSIGNLEKIDAHVGHIASHKIFQCLAGELVDFFGERAVAGRSGTNEIIILFKDERDSRTGANLFDALAMRLKKKAFMQESTYSRQCRDFSIRASMENFKPTTPYNVMVQSLRERQREIASVHCNKREKGL